MEEREKLEEVRSFLTAYLPPRISRGTWKVETVVSPSLTEADTGGLGFEARGQHDIRVIRFDFVPSMVAGVSREALLAVLAHEIGHIGGTGLWQHPLPFEPTAWLRGVRYARQWGVLPIYRQLFEEDLLMFFDELFLPWGEWEIAEVKRAWKRIHKRIHRG